MLTQERNSTKYAFKQELQGSKLCPLRRNTLYFDYQGYRADFIWIIFEELRPLNKEYSSCLPVDIVAAISSFRNFKIYLNKITRPGVDKVKPKGWFKYSLQTD